jgi:hypothetical protein
MLLTNQKLTQAMSLIPKSRKIFIIIFLISVFNKNIAISQEYPIVKAKSILKSISNNKPIYLKNVKIEGDIDFTKLSSNPESSFQNRVKISSPIYFQNCIFKGKIKGYHEKEAFSIATFFETNLSFNNCTFYDDILLNGAIVGTSFIMAESKLHGELHLENALITHNANFSGVIFGRKVFFQNTVFRKNAYFNKTIFNEVGNFQSCKWEGEAIFREVEFRENIDFSLQKSYSLMSFNFSFFKNMVIFEGSRFWDDFEMDNVSAKKILLSKSQFWQKLNTEGLNSKDIDFTDSIFYAIIPDFSKINHSETILNQMGIRFPNL